MYRPCLCYLRIESVKSTTLTLANPTPEQKRPHSTRIVTFLCLSSSSIQGFYNMTSEISLVLVWPLLSHLRRSVRLVSLLSQSERYIASMRCCYCELYLSISLIHSLRRGLLASLSFCSLHTTAYHCQSSSLFVSLGSTD